MTDKQHTSDLAGMAARILQLEDEVRRLKRVYVDTVSTREARKRLIAEVEDWRMSGKTVEQLLFRLRTCPLRSEERREVAQ